MSERESKARSLLQAQQQEHVFKFFDSLSNEEQDSLLTQIESIDFELLDKLSKKIQTETSDQENLTLEPAPIITLPNDEKSLDQHWCGAKFAHGANALATFMSNASTQNTRHSSIFHANYLVIKKYKRF